MLAAILLAALLPPPAPEPSAQSAPLKTIVTVRSSSFCTQFAQHINDAIAAALSNDATMGTLILTLKTRDLSGNPFSRMGEIARLTQLGASIYANYRTGEGQVALLRNLESHASDEKQRVELKAAADALGGALYRQHLIQRDLDGFVAFLQAADMRRSVEPTGSPTNPPVMPVTYNPSQYQHPLPFEAPGDETLDDDVRLADEASDDFAQRLAPVRSDEIDAAGHIGSVSQGC